MFEGKADLVRALDATHREVSSAERRLLELIRLAEAEGVWRNDGARDLPHWLSIRYGISWWKAHRWIAAAHALPTLARISEAFEEGELGIDQVVELTRFATPETEARLLAWAKTVSPAAVRRRADREVRTSTETDVQAHEARFLEWWYLEEDRRLGLRAELPAAQGEVIVRAIKRMTERIPQMPGEEDPVYVSARRADALVALCGAQIAADPDPDRATVIVHATLGGLATDGGGSELESGEVLHPETTKRLLCTARVQTVVEDQAGDVVALGRMRREPAPWLARQVRYRDRECRFPGCGTRAFTQAHHLRWWRHGGRTELANLLLICSFHHRLVHELGWKVHRDPDGTVRWFRPDGTRYRAGPSPGRGGPQELASLAAVG